MRGLRIIALSTAILLSTGLTVTAQASNNPAPLWDAAQSAGSTGFDEATAVDALRSGEPVVVGNFSGTAYLPTSPDDSIALVSPGSQSIFVALMDPAGEYFTWAIAAGGAGGSGSVADVAVVGKSTPSTADDRVVIAGTFDSGSQMIFPGPNGDIPLTRYGTIDMYYASLQPGAGFTRVTRVGQPEPFIASGDAIPTSIAVAPDERVIIAGVFTGMISFPQTMGSVTLTTTESSYQMFVAGMNVGMLTERFAWAQHAGGPGELTGVELTADPSSGRITLAGSARFGTTYFPTGRPSPDDSIALSSDDTSSVFVTSMSSDDTYFDWVQSVGGVGFSAPATIASSSDGGVLIGGRFSNSVTFPQTGGGGISLASLTAQSDGFVAAMGADDSAFAWATPLSSTATDFVSAIAVSPSGTALVAGGFEGALSVPAASGAISLATALGEPDAFVAAMTPGSPDFTWVQVARGQSDSDGATTNSMAFTSPTRAVLAGRMKGSMAFPIAGGTETISTRIIIDAFTATISLPQAPAPSPEPVPASAPTSVTALGGDASARVSWTAPTTSGSFAVSTYLVTASPGGRTCLVSAPSLSCEVTSLTNGTVYTFTVKALTGAGWSVASEPSNSVTPAAPLRPSVVISGARDGRLIAVTGTASGLDAGVTLRPWLRVAGQPSFSPGAASIPVGEDGRFTWDRRAGKRVTVYVETSDGSLRSNRVAIPAR